MKKLFTINKAPYSVQCLLYADGYTSFHRVIIYCHGFGGHKETKAAMHFADYVIAGHKDVAVVCFDWPCHGEDARKKLSLDDCDAYLRILISYAKETLGAEEVFLYATSFGGYLSLKYIMDHGNPWEKVALRCPAVHMSEVLEQRIMNEENRALLAEGRDALVGFDRKIKVSPQFLHELQDADITGTSYLNYADKILILHGTKDEIVSFDAVKQFADKNRIRFVPVENADHRFIDPEKMEEAIQLIEQFLLSSQHSDCEK